MQIVSNVVCFVATWNVFIFYKTLTVHLRRNAVNYARVHSVTIRPIFEVKTAWHDVRGLRVAYRVANALNLIRYN